MEPAMISSYRKCKGDCVCRSDSALFIPKEKEFNGFPLTARFHHFMPQRTKQPAKWNTDPLTTSGRAIASEDKEGEPRRGKEEDLAGV